MWSVGWWERLRDLEGGKIRLSGTPMVVRNDVPEMQFKEQPCWRYGGLGFEREIHGNKLNVRQKSGPMELRNCDTRMGNFSDILFIFYLIFFPILRGALVTGRCICRGARFFKRGMSAPPPVRRKGE